MIQVCNMFIIRFIEFFLTELYFSGKSTRLCERHFTNDMFVVQSMDSNYYRQQRTLKRRRLRPSAVPTIFPNCPTFMTKSAAPIRSTTSSAASRFNREEISHELHVDAFFDDDKVSDLSDLTSKLKLSVLPSGFFLSEVESGVLIYLLNTDDIPCISTSLFIKILFVVVCL